MAQLETYRGYPLWHYLPSIPAAVIFAILFFAASIFHAWKIWKLKTKFCTCFTIGGFFEVIGYAARVAAHNATGRIMPYSIQSVFILLGPPLFAASIYMVLAQLIRSVKGEQYSIVRVNWLTKIFVTGDVLSFVVQGGAAGMMVSSDLADMGNKIVIAGLLIQVIMFGLFIVTAIIFQVRFGKGQIFHTDLPWKSHLNILYAVSLLIMVRSVFRVIEFIMGNDGYLLMNEWPLYVFDAVLMFFVMVIFGYWYPGDLKQRQGSEDVVLVGDVAQKA